MSQSIRRIGAQFPRRLRRRARGAHARRSAPAPKVVEIDDGVATYDEWVAYKQPDWTYLVPPGRPTPRRRTFGTPGR
ncbi:MAG TPA: hypothetical protein VI462_02145 [Acidimicrobiia bacterium]